MKVAGQHYNAELQEFIRLWRPNDPEADKRFVEGVRSLIQAILKPPTNTIEVTNILSPTGGKVCVRLGDYEAQLDPLDAQHLALSLIESATGARTESWMYRFLREHAGMPDEMCVRMIGEFRNYRAEEMQKELAGDFEKRSVPLP